MEASKALVGQELPTTMEMEAFKELVDQVPITMMMEALKEQEDQVAVTLIKDLEMKEVLKEVEVSKVMEIKEVNLIKIRGELLQKHQSLETIYHLEELEEILALQDKLKFQMEDVFLFHLVVLP